MSVAAVRFPRPPGEPGDQEGLDATARALIEEARKRTRRRRRIYGAVAALVALVGVSLASVFDLASTAPARSQNASPIAAARNATLQGSVAISIVRADDDRRFDLSGVIEDHGTYVDSPLCCGTEMRVLHGAKGTIWMTVGVGDDPPCQCHWRITRGTGAYTELRGRGTESGWYTGRTADVSMVGTVARQ